MFNLILSILFTVDARYHTYDEVLFELDSLAYLYPHIMKVETLGYSSVRNKAILGVKISSNVEDNEDKPAILFVGVHHAEEIMGCEAVMYVISRLLSGYGQDTLMTKFVNELEMWFIPILNPDGHEIVMSGVDTTWRKNLRDNNGNGFFDPDSDGVDLNRNYSFNWDLGGSPNPTSEYYRGPYPFSESETQVVQNLSQQIRFLLAIDFHSARTGQGEVIYYPWRWGANFCVDFPFIRAVADTLARSILNDNGSGTYTAIYGSATEGNFRNYLYATYGTYAYTMEISWGCILPGEVVDEVLTRVFEGIKTLLNRAFGSMIVVEVVDYTTGEPIEAEVRLEGYYDSLLPPRLTDPNFGKFRKIVIPGNYTISVQKEGYRSEVLENIQVANLPLHVLVRLHPLSGVEEGVQKNFKLKWEINTKRGILRFKNSATNSVVADFEIFDCSGRKVLSHNLYLEGAEEYFLDLRKVLKGGVYFITVIEGNNRVVERFPYLTE